MGCCGWKATDKNPTVPRSRLTLVQDLVGRQRAAAETALAEVTGGESVCRVGPDRLGPVKEAEGRLAAIAELQRALRDRDRTVASQVASDLAHAWRDEAARAQTRGETWLAYRQGGADALDAMTVELQARDVARSRTA